MSINSFLVSKVLSVATSSFFPHLKPGKQKFFLKNIEKKTFRGSQTISISEIMGRNSIIKSDSTVFNLYKLFGLAYKNHSSFAWRLGWRKISSKLYRSELLQFSNFYSNARQLWLWLSNNIFGEQRLICLIQKACLWYCFYELISGRQIFGKKTGDGGLFWLFFRYSKYVVSKIKN